MVFKYWDDKCVVYNSTSADTHLLTTFSAKILELYKIHGNTDSLIKAIKRTYQLDSIKDFTTEEITQLIDSQINQFKHLKLLE